MVSINSHCILFMLNRIFNTFQNGNLNILFGGATKLWRNKYPLCPVSLLMFKFICETIHCKPSPKFTIPRLPSIITHLRNKSGAIKYQYLRHVVWRHVQIRSHSSKSSDLAFNRVIPRYGELLVFPHDDVIKWKHLPRYWPFVRGIHRSPNKGQWRETLMFSLICAWMNGWVHHRNAGDFRRHRAHYVSNISLE